MDESHPLALGVIGVHGKPGANMPVPHLPTRLLGIITRHAMLRTALKAYDLSRTGEDMSTLDSQLL